MPSAPAKRRARRAMLVMALAAVLLHFQQAWCLHGVVHAAEAASEHAATLQSPVDACGPCALLQGGGQAGVGQSPYALALSAAASVGAAAPTLASFAAPRFYDSQAPPAVS